MKTAEQIIQERIDYGKKYRLTNLDNGWSGIESGECCDKCKMSSDETNPLRVLVGCRNPFQLPEVCQCHLPFRKVAEESIQQALLNILSEFKREKVNDAYLLDLLKWMYVTNIQAEDNIDNHHPKHHWRMGEEYLTNDELIEKYKKSYQPPTKYRFDDGGNQNIINML